MEPGTSLSRDEIFFLLSSRRRRFVLRYLRRTGGAVDRSDLVDELAAWENDVDVEYLSGPQRRTVDVSLYQTHLEELSDAGVVTYDADTGRVEATDRLEGFAGYLDRWKEIGLDGVGGTDSGETVQAAADRVDRSSAATDREDESAGATVSEEGSAGGAAARADAGDGGLRPLHYLGLAAASLGLYLAVVVDSGVLWRVPLFVAAVVVIGLVAVHVYPLYTLRKRGPFRAK